VPTRTRPGVIGWPLPQRSGGRTIHSPRADRTRSPTSWLICQVYPTAATYPQRHGGADLRDVVYGMGFTLGVIGAYLGAVAIIVMALSAL
jgi:hypothetical protein